MTFDDVNAVEQVCWQMKLADYPRDLNRAKINSLFNGDPPFSDLEVEQNSIEFNVNPLTGTRLMHVARQQFYQAFMKPGKFFGCRTDSAKVPRHKRTEVNTTVTAALNKIMKRNAPYFEKNRGTFASTLLHGVGPGTWDDRWKWCSRMTSMADVLIPSGRPADLPMSDLPFIAIYRSYTGSQLRKLTSGPKFDPGWNMPLVDWMIDWIDKEAQALVGTVWPEVWSPTKQQERTKGDGGYYASDAVPTIDCYDFRYYADEGKKSGWRRRIILDTYGSPGAGGMNNGRINYAAARGDAKYKDIPDDAKGFLYDSGNRVFADSLSQQISFQFADLSAVSPFNYHTIRSLGMLLWSVTHIQNRLYNAGMEATFEALMQYFRVKSMDDVERVIALRLVNRAFLDESTQFIGKDQRWQTDIGLLEYAYGQNDQIIREDAGSFSQKQEFSEGRERKTKFQVMAEVNAASTLISTGLLQAYTYQNFEYREIFRRFCQPNSKDPDVREFRLECLRNGVPEEALVPEAWDISSEQVLGAGNKTLELTIAQQLMEMRNLYDPEAQRKILRDVTLAVTDNAAMADELVPEEPTVSDSTEDAQRAAGSMLQGLPVEFRQGVSHLLYAQALLTAMGATLQKIMTMQGGAATMDDISGLINLAGVNLQGQPTSKNGVQAHINQLAQDESEKQTVKKLGDALGKLMNQIKALAQQLEERMKKEAEAAQQGNGQMDLKDAAKIKATIIGAQVKAQNALTAHGQRTAQRQIQSELKIKQDEQRHQQDLRHKAQDATLELHKKAAETVIDIQAEKAKNRMRSLDSDE